VPSKQSKVPPEVANRIGPYYIYLLVDPRDGAPFYVGKGTKDRVAAHGRAAGLEDSQKGPSAKVRRIRAIRDAGLEPRIEIVCHHLSDEKTAFKIESALIDSLPGLTNAVKGHDAAEGRTTLDDLVNRYGATPLTRDVEPALLIRLTPRFIPGDEELERGSRRSGAGWAPTMTSQQVLDATRGWWKVSPSAAKKRGVHLAVPVAQGVTRAVYAIDDWVGPRGDGRCAFKAHELVDGPIHDAYVGPLGKRVPFLEHSQNPTMYWPPKP
jgi:uncharacterized protein